jgi:hypothetical protein
VRLRLAGGQKVPKVSRRRENRRSAARTHQQFSVSPMKPRNCRCRHAPGAARQKDDLTFTSSSFPRSFAIGEAIQLSFSGQPQAGMDNLGFSNGIPGHCQWMRQGQEALKPAARRWQRYNLESVEWWLRKRCISRLGRLVDSRAGQGKVLYILQMWRQIFCPEQIGMRTPFRVNGNGNAGEKQVGFGDKSRHAADVQWLYTQSWSPDCSYQLCSRSGVKRFRLLGIAISCRCPAQLLPNYPRMPFSPASYTIDTSQPVASRLPGDDVDVFRYGNGTIAA